MSTVAFWNVRRHFDGQNVWTSCDQSLSFIICIEDCIFRYTYGVGGKKVNRKGKALNIERKAIKNIEVVYNYTREYSCYCLNLFFTTLLFFREQTVIFF